MNLKCLTAEISHLSPEGRGVAHVEGKATFVSGALPGETVSFHRAARHRHFDEGWVVEVLTPSPQRLMPKCAAFGRCGGCCLQMLSGSDQRAFKEAMVLEQLSRIGGVQPERVYPPLLGDSWGYRHKARLGVRYVAKKQGVLVGFREQRSHWVTEIERCEILEPRIGERVSVLREMLGQLSVAGRLAQLEVAVDDQVASLTLRHLAELSAADRDRLSQFAQEYGLYWYLQSAGPQSVVPLWPVDLPVAGLSYALPNEGVSFQFAPFDFTQVNFAVNRQMVAQAMTWLAPQAGESVLDLFCGVGNFSLPLANYAERVVGIEGDSQLVARAKANAQRQGFDQVEFVVKDLAKLNWVEGRWVDKELGEDCYQKVLLDPPRSGAWEILQHLPLQKTEKVLYVSCNPATLARDAGELVRQKGYRLAQVGIMDMFPHTAHVEVMALFERR